MEKFKVNANMKMGRIMENIFLILKMEIFRVNVYMKMAMDYKYSMTSKVYKLLNV